MTSKLITVLRHSPAPQVAFPAIYLNRLNGAIWLQVNESGDCILLYTPPDYSKGPVGSIARTSPCHDKAHYIRIEEPMTITFNP
jgi:hypothetical protein